MGIRVLLVAGAFVVLCSRTAGAQTGLDIQLFRPSPHSESFFATESGAVAGPVDLRAGIWAIYAFRPLQAYDAQGRLVQGFLDHRVDAAVTASFAFLDRVSMGLVVPFTLFQIGNVDLLLPQPLARVAFGDIRIEAKGFILAQKREYLDLALLAFLTFPSGYEQGFAGDRSFTGGGELDVGRSFNLFRFAFNFGAVGRQTAQLIDLTIGSELYYRLGIGLDFGKISKVPLELIAEITGRTPLLAPFSQVALSPLEWAAGLKYKPLRWFEMNLGGGRAIIPGYGAPAARAFLNLTFAPFYDEKPASAPAPVRTQLDSDGDGIFDDADKCVSEAEDKDGFEDQDGCPETDNDKDGVLDAADKCPMSPEDWDDFEDSDGCPESDNDKDGLFDNIDKCPMEPEDHDDFMDEDGCPDADNDGDGIVDMKDACPNEPETINEVDDFDGCPDESKQVTLAFLETQEIRIDDKVHFKLGKAIIDKRSFGMLTQVANLIHNHASISKVRVEGHTDELGSVKLNLKLSQKRAEAVAAFLIKKGVAPERLDAIGYGKSKPIASNKTMKGRSANRRVAFVVLQPEVDEKKRPPAPVK